MVLHWLHFWQTLIVSTDMWRDLECTSHNCAHQTSAATHCSDTGIYQKQLTHFGIWRNRTSFCCFYSFSVFNDFGETKSHPKTNENIRKQHKMHFGCRSYLSWCEGVLHVFVSCSLSCNEKSIHRAVSYVCVLEDFVSFFIIAILKGTPKKATTSTLIVQ